MPLHCTLSSGNATLRPYQGLEVRHSQMIHIVKLDDFLGPKLQRLDFMKIDTEGFEDDVLAGAVAIIRRFRPVICIELSSEYLNSSKEAMRILRDNGYAFEKELVLEECHNGENFIALPVAS